MGILDAPSASKKDFDKSARRRKRLLDYYNPLDKNQVAAHENVMASPPTVTIGTVAGAASSLTNPRDYGAAASSTAGSPVIAPFRVYGAKVGVVTNTAVSVYNQNMSTTSNSVPYYIDFLTDAPSFELRVYGGTNGYYRMRVDGELVSTTANVSNATSGSYRDLHAFGSRKMRHIEIECANAFRFHGVCITTADTIMPASNPIGPRAVWIGDSYAAGIGATNYLVGSTPLAARTLGWKDTFNAGVGGTGYLADGGGTGGKTKLITRLPTDCYAYNPEIVVLSLGFNDWYNTLSPAAVTTEALACFNDIKANLPNATLIVVGLLSMQVTVTTQTNMAAAIDSAVTQAGSKVDLYIKAIGGPGGDWIDNSAQVATYRHADGIHPSQNGHVLLAQRITNAIRAGLPIG